MFLRLALDQGYWPESILTPPSDEAIQYDIQMTKAFGFNGVRKHQKAEDPRFLYWADKMGLRRLGRDGQRVLPTARSTWRASRREWEELVARDYNHPSIIAWVPINESWGVPQILTDPRAAGAREGDVPADASRSTRCGRSSTTTAGSTPIRPTC